MSRQDRLGQTGQDWTGLYLGTMLEKCHVGAAMTGFGKVAAILQADTTHAGAMDVRLIREMPD